MKIIISQQGKKILITFKNGKAVDKYQVDKADEFLLCVDKFLKRRKIGIEVFKKAGLEFINVGLLTERVVKAIIVGLRL